MEIIQSQGLIRLESYNQEDILVKKTVGLWLKDSEYIITGVEILENCTNIKMLCDNKLVTLKYAWLDLENHILILKSDIPSNYSISTGYSNNLKLGERIFITKSSEFNVLSESNINGLSKLKHQSLYNVRLFSSRYFTYSNQGNNENYQFIFNEKHELIGVFTETKTGSHSINNFALRINELNLLTQTEKRSYYPVKDIAVLHNAEVMYQRKEYEKAIEHYNAFLVDNSDNYYIILERAKAFINKRNFNQAIADCDKAMKLKPDYALSYAIKAYAYVKQKDFSKAARLFTEAINRGPSYIDNYFNAAYCFHKMLNYENAFASLNKLQELEPNNAAIFQIKGDLYYENTLFDKAIEMYSKSINMDKDNKELYYCLGWSHYNAGNHFEALDYSKKAIEFNLRDAYAYHLKALCLYELNNTPEAIYNESMAINLQPDNPEFYHFRASYYFTTAKFDESVQDFSKHIYLTSNYDRLNKYLSMILRAAKDAKVEDTHFFNFSFALVEEFEKVLQNKNDSQLENIYKSFKNDILNTLQPIFLFGALRQQKNTDKTGNNSNITNDSKNIFSGRKIISLKDKNILIKIFQRLNHMGFLNCPENNISSILELHFVYENSEQNNPEIKYSQLTQIKWTGSQSFLIYFIYRLIKREIINKVSLKSYANLITTHFYNQKLNKSFDATAISKQTEQNTNQHTDFPKYFTEFDSFLSTL